MAVPIASIPDTSESASEIYKHLESSRVSHAKAILASYELLQQLHDARVIDLLRGVLAAGDTLVTKVAVAGNSPESINAIRNLVSMAKILGSIDPDVLHSLADELSSRKPKESIAPPARLWTAVRMFASADSRRALVGSAAFLQAFGRALLKGKTTRSTCPNRTVICEIGQFNRVGETYFVLSRRFDLAWRMH
jgi:uncharacterized protein YjgD (DUF1641 family)